MGMDDKKKAIDDLTLVVKRLEAGEETLRFNIYGSGHLKIWWAGTNVHNSDVNSQTLTRVISALLNEGPHEFAEIVASRCKEEIGRLKDDLTDEFANAMRG